MFLNLEGYPPPMISFYAPFIISTRQLLFSTILLAVLIQYFYAFLFWLTALTLTLTQAVITDCSV